jgi:hypothetical protein
MSKTEKIKASVIILFITFVVGLVIYNSIVHGIARYPYDGI